MRALLAIGTFCLVAAAFIPVPVPAPNLSAAPPAGEAAGALSGFEPIRWSDLVPAGWEPSFRIRELQKDLATADDADVRARASLDEVRGILDAAPIEPRWNGRKVRIAGYVVPLGGWAQKDTEFLLVPYFGACIHTPPPAANQVIHVVAANADRAWRAMEVVQVAGTLEAVRHDTAMARTGYRLVASAVMPEPRRRP